MASSFIAQTFAVTPIWCQLKSRFANTFKTAIFIDTHSIKAHVPYAAFVHIWKIRKDMLSYDQKSKFTGESNLNEYNSFSSHLFCLVFFLF